MKKTMLLLLSTSVLASCSFGPPSKITRNAFTISSEQGAFAIRGRLGGSYSYDTKQFRITVDQGTIVSTFDDQNDLRLRPKIAGPGAKDARLVAEGQSRSIGDFKKLAPRELPRALHFTIPLPVDFDPDNQWLVFELVQSNDHFSVICDSHNLSEAKGTAIARRPTGVCWGNP